MSNARQRIERNPCLRAARTADCQNKSKGCVANVVARARRGGEGVAFQRKLVFDSRKPEGTRRELLDVSKLKVLGWLPKIGLEAGIAAT